MLGEYYTKAASEIDEMEHEANEWRSKMERADSPVMRQYYEKIQDIHDKCDAARIALNACVVGGKNVSEPEKQGLEKALDAVREALNDLAARAKDSTGD